MLSRSKHVVILTYFWLEEYRKTVEVDGELTWVGIIFALVAKLSAVLCELQFARWILDGFMSILPLTF